MMRLIPSMESMVLAVTLAACSAPRPDHDIGAGFHACSAGVRIDTSEWQTIEERDFSFRLPPSFTEDDVQGIDSHVRQWSDGRGRTLAFDYGWYSSTLEEFRQNESATECETTVGDRHALAAAARGFAGDPASENGWVVGISWRDLRVDRGTATHLTMHASAPDTAGAAELMAAMRSTVFHLDD